MLGLALVAAACSSSSDGDAVARADTAGATTEASAADGDPADDDDALTDDDPADATETGLGAPGGVIGQVTTSWETDWSMRTIDLDELALGIQTLDPRDQIPPIDEPTFESLDDAADWLVEASPGALVEVDGIRRFYPLAILTQHEIVNDRFGEVPVAVTYCPLCNTAIAFDRRVDGEELRFGVSGLLRNSDLVMWDDATTSLWQQATGEGLVGEFAGTQLEFISTAITSYGEVVSSFPDAVALSRDTGFPGRSYGSNPYVAYSSSAAPIAGFFDGEIDDRLPPLDRVVGITLDEGELAVPFATLTDLGAVNTTVGSTPVVVLWASGTADALDAAAIDLADDVGTGVALSPVLDDQILTMSANGDGTFTDAETGSRWDVLGNGQSGPLEGRRLEPVTHRNDFWFAWQAFFPDAEFFTGS